MQRGQVSTTALIAILIVLVLIAGLLLALSRSSTENKVLSVNSFEDCVAAGYPVAESYPEQCRTPDGRVFVQSIEAASSSTSIDASTSAQGLPPTPEGIQPAY